MMGMNFTGQYKKARHINLGGRNARNATTANREALLRKAQADRERRERAVVEERSAIRIQSFFRGRSEAYKHRLQFGSHWAPVMYNDDSVDAFLKVFNEFLYFFPKTYKSLDNSLQQIQQFESFLKKTDNSGTPMLSKIPQETLHRYLTRLTHFNDLAQIKDLVSVKPDDKNNYFEILLSMLEIFYTVLPYVSFNVQPVLSKVLKYSILNHYIRESPTAVDRLRDISLKILKNQITSIPFDSLTDGFIGIFITPNLHFFFTPQDFFDILPSELKLASTRPPSFYRNRNSFPDHEIVWAVSNFVHFFKNVYIKNQPFLFHSTLSILLGLSSFSLDSKKSSNSTNTSPDINEQQDEKLLENIASLFSNPFIQEQFDYITDRDFVSNLLELFIKPFADSNSITITNELVVFSQTITSLLSLKPSRKVQTLFTITLSNYPVISMLWLALQQSELYNTVLNQNLRIPELITIIDKNDNVLDVLFLFMNLCQFWLIVATDSEFHGSVKNNGINGLERDQVQNLAQFLKKLCFILIWHGASADKSDFKFALISKNTAIYDILTGVMKSIYARDSRRQFLPNDFWLMTNAFEMDHFVKSVAQEQRELFEWEEEEKLERLMREKNRDDDDDDDDEEEKKPKPEPTTPVSKLVFAPRLELLREAPFFIPFDTRLKVFQEFITQMRNCDERLNTHFFDSFGRILKPIGKIRRDHLLEDAFKAFNALDSDFKQEVTVVFLNEHGAELGVGPGVTKEFLIQVSQEGFKPSEDGEYHIDTKRGLFSATKDHLLYPNPLLGISSKYSNLTKEERDDGLTYMMFLGKIIGKCLFENILVDVEFAPFFLQKWTLPNFKNSFNDLYSLDPEIYDNIIKLCNYPGNVETDFMLDFTIDQNVGHGKQATIELIPGGSKIPVTNANRLEYAHLVANYKLNAALYQQTKMFYEGLSMIIPPRWLNMFNARELQMLIAGRPSVFDVDDLRANTVLLGFKESDETIQNFWEVLHELTDEQKSQFLKFVTSAPKAPLLGFRALTPNFAIRNAGDDRNRLPTASTCINLLKLSDMKSKELLKQKLLESIANGIGFELS